MQQKISIEVQHVNKSYKLYRCPLDRLKEVFFLKKYHKDFNALQSVNFSITKGEKVGLIGVNGSGKSTLLKIITGVLSPSSGFVKVHGKISALLELGAGFNPEYTGLENIYFQADIMGIAKTIEIKLQDIIAFADIGEFIYQPVKNYSSGMFARLAFAIAVHVNPDVLIVDESLAVGDVFFQQKCNLYLQKNMRNTTQIIVTHDIVAMQNMCDRLILLENGMVVFDGAIEEGVNIYLRKLHNSFDTKIDLLENNNFCNQTENQDFEKLIWQDVESKDIGGSKRVVIKKIFYSVNGNSFQNFIKKNDVMKVKIIVNSQDDIENVIVGCAFFDKFNNQIFGGTSITNNILHFSLKKGVSTIEFKMIWPEVKSIDYFGTVGLGSGTDELHHEILCWAYRQIYVKPIQANAMHGFFNNEIFDIMVKGE